MTKKELIERLHESVGENITKKDIEHIIEQFGSVVRSEAKQIYETGKVKKSDYIPFPMLGRIKFAISKERKGLNPQTLKPLTIKRTMRIRIKIGSLERECIEE